MTNRIQSGRVHLSAWRLLQAYDRHPLKPRLSAAARAVWLELILRNVGWVTRVSRSDLQGATGFSSSTVGRALSQLCQEGIIARRGGRRGNGRVVFDLTPIARGSMPAGDS